MNDIIMALGSNFNQTENMCSAKAAIKKHFALARFTGAVWTEPEDMESKERFLNCLCRVTTQDDIAHVNSFLKETEKEIGRTPEGSKKGIIAIDMDILKFNDAIMHEKDWQRGYIKELMKHI